MSSAHGRKDEDLKFGWALARGAQWQVYETEDVRKFKTISAMDFEAPNELFR